MKNLLLVIVCLCYCAAVAQNPWKNIYSEHAWSERDAWQRPEELMRLLDVRQGHIVADVGCHEGYMTFKLAKAVGADGMVYAVDLDRSKLDKVNSRSESHGLRNIRTVLGDPDDPTLPANSIDRMIILDTYHEMDDHEKILQNIKASLKKHGRLLICEPIADERRDQPRSEQKKKHELALSYALADLKEAGFRIVFQKDNFIDRTREKGDKMWVVVVEKI